MAARQFLRRINIHHINLLLYVVIVGVAVLYRRELRWAWEEFPVYLDGGISSPYETQWYREARKIIRNSGDISEAQALLEKSISIDPNTEAVYWLGEFFYQTQHYDLAMPLFTRYLEIDPTIS